jgi:hypothetical protein
MRLEVGDLARHRRQGRSELPSGSGETTGFDGGDKSVHGVETVHLLSHITREYL